MLGMFIMKFYYFKRKIDGNAEYFVISSGDYCGVLKQKPEGLNSDVYGPFDSLSYLLKYLDLPQWSPKVKWTALICQKCGRHFSEIPMKLAWGDLDYCGFCCLDEII